MTIVARDVMNTLIVSVSPSTTLVDLERLLIGKNVGGTPVLEHGKLVGMVSRSDIVRVLSYEQSLAEVQSGAFQNELGISDRRAVELIGGQVGERMQKLTVRDAMTEVRAQVDASTPIRDIARMMMGERVHRVLVTDADQVIGIVSRSDLVRLIADGKVGDIQ